MFRYLGGDLIDTIDFSWVSGINWVGVPGSICPTYLNLLRGGNYNDLSGNVRGQLVECGVPTTFINKLQANPAYPEAAIFPDIINRLNSIIGTLPAGGGSNTGSSGSSSGGSSSSSGSGSSSGGNFTDTSTSSNPGVLDILAEYKTPIMIGIAAILILGFLRK